MNIRELKISDREAFTEFKLKFRNETDFFAPPIMQGDHFEESLNKKNTKFFIAKGRTKIVGLIRVCDRANGNIDVGFGLLKRAIGKGIGTEMIKFIEKEYPDIRNMIAVCMRRNWRAIVFFVKNGFRVVKETGDVVTLEKNYECKEA